MTIIRGFEVVDDWARKNPLADIKLPERSTNFSAGYDIVAPDDYIIGPKGQIVFWTDIKAYMMPDEYLRIVIRSSLGIKKGLFLLNQVGVIDHDYYSNQSNDGNIGVAIGNRKKRPVQIYKGEKVVQGIFSKYLLADKDNSNGVRTGGVGSTS